jgi:hypothetical protein
VRGVLGGEDQCFQSREHGDEVLGPRFNEMCRPGGAGGDDFFPALLSRHPLIPHQDLDRRIGVIPALLRDADRPAVAVNLQRGRFRTRRGERREHLREPVVAKVEVDEEVIGRTHLDHLPLAPRNQHVAVGNGNAAKRFHPPRRTKKPGHGVQDINPGIERRADRFTVEHGRVAFVIEPRGGTHIGHLTHGERRAAEPAAVQALLQPAEAVRRHDRRRAEERQPARSGQIDGIPRLGHGRGKRFLGKDMLARVQSRDIDLVVKRGRRQVENRGDVGSGQQVGQRGHDPRPGQPPRFQIGRQQLGAHGIRIEDGDGRRPVRAEREPGCVRAQGDVAAANDAKSDLITSHHDPPLPRSAAAQ